MSLRLTFAMMKQNYCQWNSAFPLQASYTHSERASSFIWMTHVRQKLTIICTFNSSVPSLWDTSNVCLSISISSIEDLFPMRLCALEQHLQQQEPPESWWHHKLHWKLGMGVHWCNLSTLETEAGVSWATQGDWPRHIHKKGLGTFSGRGVAWKYKALRPVPRTTLKNL